MSCEVRDTTQPENGYALVGTHGRTTQAEMWTHVLFQCCRISADKDLTNCAFDRVLKHNKHYVLGQGNHCINPISREDVAEFIADCVVEKHKPGKDYPVRGPDMFTFREIGKLASQPSAPFQSCWNAPTAEMNAFQFGYTD